MQAARVSEHLKYERAYAIETYAMGEARKRDATRDLKALPSRGSYVDLGCGRGEMLEIAEQIGFKPVFGLEVVEALLDPPRIIYGQAHDIPFADKSVDVATMFDVIEHLIPGDDEHACRELARIARRHVVLTANNQPSNLPDGTDLHINRRPYDEWDRLFIDWFSPGVVTRIDGPRDYVVSPAWRVDL